MTTSRSDMTLEPNKVEDFIRECNKDPGRSKYLNEVYKLLNRMKPGERVYLDKLVSTPNLELFIQCACCYIVETKAAEFDNSYNFLKKL